MSKKFAFDFMNLNRPDRTPAVSYDKVYSSLQKMMDSKQERDIKESNFDLKIVQQLLCSYKPDLSIVCEDEEIIQTYKLLLGMTSKLLGDIFLQEDFVTEPVTTILVPIHSKQVKLMVNYFENGSKLPGDITQMFSINESPLTNTKGTFSKDDPDTFMSDEVEAVDNIKVEEEGEIHIQAKPVLIKFQSIIRAKKNKESKKGTKCPKTKCLKCFKNYRYMEKHTPEKCDRERARQMKREYKVPCELCGKLLTQKHMKSHMQKWHNPEEKTYYNCDQCAFRTSYMNVLKQHMKDHEEGVVLETCHICGGKYKRLEQHIKRSHPKPNYYTNVVIKCEICGKEIKKARLSNHMKQMHMERKHACHLCSYKAQTSYNLKLHISKSHLGVKELEKEQCPHCDVLTTNLPYHLKIYHP